MGISFTKGEKTGNFGSTNLRDSVEFFFDEQNPLIGIYGNNDGTDYLHGIGFITYDLGDECQAYVPPPPEPVIDPEFVPIVIPEEDKEDEGGIEVDDEEIPEEPIDVVIEPEPETETEIIEKDVIDLNIVIKPESATTAEEADVEKKGIDLITIGIYTGGVVGVILIVFIIVMIVEKIRKKNKRITEIVEFAPVDLDAHFKGI